MQMIGLARLGQDCETPRYTADGTAVVNLSLAFHYGLKAQDGSKPTQWIDAAMFGTRVEKLGQYLTKGSLILVALDDPHIEEFTRRDGTVGTKLVGRVASIEFTGRAPEQGGQQPASQPATTAPLQYPARQAATSSIADMESDIPF